MIYLTAFGLVISLLLGGGTRSGLLSDALLQFASIPVLLVGLWRILSVPLSGAMRFALGLCTGVITLPVLQLIPLPPAIWTRLPGREAVSAAFELTGHAFPWAPLSMSPYATWLSALSLLPPVAVFLATASLHRKERRSLGLVLIGIGLASVFLGLMQVMQGPSSPLRFYDYTNDSETVGFFANRNHFAALLYSLILLTAAWGTSSASTTNNRPHRDRFPFEMTPTVRIIISFTALVAFIAAEVMARSRGGMTLTLVALFGAFALIRSNWRATNAAPPARMVLGATMLALVLSAQYALYRLSERFDVDRLSDARIVFARNTIDAAKSVMPYGAGLGAFVPFYAMFEKPRDLMPESYANHAHNDFLELWLETGIAGLALVSMFVVWLAYQGSKVWRRSYCEGLAIDRALSRAAFLIIVLLLAHSIVDYPLRTNAIAAVFAFACALLIDPPTRPREDERGAPGNGGVALKAAPVTARPQGRKASGFKRLQSG